MIINKCRYVDQTLLIVFRKIFIYKYLYCVIMINMGKAYLVQNSKMKVKMAVMLQKQGNGINQAKVAKVVNRSRIEHAPKR